MNDKIQKIVDNNKPKRRVWKNTLQAFLIGGLICLLAEVLVTIFKELFALTSEMASNLSVTIMVFLGALLTALGIYDKIGQFAGAGTIIPITGFANSMTSSAMESKSEGLVLGVLTNMFKLAGSIIAVGVISAFLVGTVIYLFEVL